MSDPIPTHERTTTVNDNNTPDWDGALAVKDEDGDVWHRIPDGTYVTYPGESAAQVEASWGPVTVVTPAPDIARTLLFGEPTEAEVKAASLAVRHERAFMAAAAFGVPLNALPECAELIARAALKAAREARA